MTDYRSVLAHNSTLDGTLRHRGYFSGNIFDPNWRLNGYQGECSLAPMPVDPRIQMDLDAVPKHDPGEIPEEWKRAFKSIGFDDLIYRPALTQPRSMRMLPTKSTSSSSLSDEDKENRARRPMLTATKAMTALKERDGKQHVLRKEQLGVLDVLRKADSAAQSN